MKHDSPSSQAFESESDHILRIRKQLSELNQTTPNILHLRDGGSTYTEPGQAIGSTQNARKPCQLEQYEIGNQQVMPLFFSRKSFTKRNLLRLTGIELPFDNIKKFCNFFSIVESTYFMFTQKERCV